MHGSRDARHQCRGTRVCRVFTPHSWRGFSLGGKHNKGGPRQQQVMSWLPGLGPSSCRTWRRLLGPQRSPPSPCPGHCPAPPPRTSGRRRLSCHLESPRCVSTSLTPHLISYLLGMSLFSSLSLAPQPEIPVHLSTCTVLGGPTGSQNPEVLGGPGPGSWPTWDVGRGPGTPTLLPLTFPLHTGFLC